MTSDLYALIALAARYWFVALIVTLLFRGWRMTVADNRRAKLLREWMGQTGCVGELIANPGSKKRVSYPIPREGVLGSAFSADVRIRHRDVKRAHAHFELREGGLLMKPMGRAALSVGGGFTGEAVFLEDGDVMTLGKLPLMLVLFDAAAQDEAEDEWFEAEPGGEPEGEDADEPFEKQPAAARARRIPVRSDRRPAQTPGDKPRKPARRGRKGAAFDLPFNPNPVPARAARGGGAPAKRARPSAADDDFSEDAIWPDL